MRRPRAALMAAALAGGAALLSCGDEQVSAGASEGLDGGEPGGWEDAGDPVVHGAGLAVAVVETIDSIAIEHAILARWRTDDPVVRALAEEQIVAFSAVGDRARELLAARRDLRPTDSEWTRELELAAWAHRQALWTATGARFDRLWLAARAAEHAGALRVLDAGVLPTLLDGDARELVIMLRETLDATSPDQRSSGTPASRWSSCTALRTSSTSGCANP